MEQREPVRAEGSYYLAFVATHGQPYVTNIALDNVIVDPTPCNVESVVDDSGGYLKLKVLVLFVTSISLSFPSKGKLNSRAGCILFPSK